MNVLRLADFPTQDIIENKSYEIEKHGLGITHILPLSKELIKKKHRVSVLAGGGLRLPRYEDVCGVNVYRTRLSMKPYYLSMGPAVLLNIKRIETERRCIDVVHSHNPCLTYGYSFVKNFIRKPFVATVHGTFYYDSFEKYFLLKMMASKVDHFIAINVPSMKILKQLGVEDDKISLVPTGVDTDIFMKVEKSEKNVLYAGRLVDWKNVGSVLDIAYNLRSTHPDVKFYIVGRGNKETALKERAVKMGLKNVFFFNDVKYEDMPKFYSKASVLLVPHMLDSFGKTVLESLACETPVVGTDFDVPDDIKRCGIFFNEPNDISGMTRAVVDIIDDGYFGKKLGKNGRSVVLKNYTWKKCAERNLIVYNNIVQ